MHTWHEAIGNEKEQPYFQHIIQSVRQEREQGQIIYPPAADVFNAFKATEFSQVKVVILGQDPYHGAGQAHGLAFSVRPDIQIPPSLVNIYKELSDDIPGFQIPPHGCLQHWAEQGVLLLNTVLTVRAGAAHSHAPLGWEQFTDRVIARLNEQRQHLVFMLWGSHAQKKGAFIDRSRHLVLTAPHPSPLSAYRGFFGCKHFSQANRYLQQHGIAEINWQI
ncbi:uracil-DNA glycosylase [Neisseria sp. ZJ104]|uniref:Uracil-DNA glycosylase n=1 Tax=Neisseria lisongii TaxID=2912188 RepID=A0AAW5AKW3_9NEIS|nr:uracil-DNA glycosylase [Neisseria lisongii]